MARWRTSPDVFPPRLQRFVEADWPRQPGECLEHYGCHAAGYGAECVPPRGQFCGEAHYAMVARDLGSEMLARTLRADACKRWRLARLAYLGDGHPDYIAELLDGWGQEQEIRYGWRGDR